MGAGSGEAQAAAYFSSSGASDRARPAEEPSIALWHMRSYSSRLLSLTSEAVHVCLQTLGGQSGEEMNARRCPIISFPAS